MSSKTEPIRSKKMNSDERRAMILSSSLKAFAEKSYMRVTTAELASIADISEPAIYKYFSSKKELFITLLEDIGSRMISRWQQIKSTENNPLLALKKIGNSHFQKVIHNIDYTNIMFQAISEVSDTDIKQSLHRIYSKFIDFISTLLQEAKEKEIISEEIDIQVIAWHFLSLGFTLNLIAMLGFQDNFNEKVIEFWGDPLLKTLES